jgi:hypothetical protein
LAPLLRLEIQNNDLGGIGNDVLHVSPSALLFTYFIDTFVHKDLLDSHDLRLCGTRLARLSVLYLGCSPPFAGCRSMLHPGDNVIVTQYESKCN